MRLCVHRNLLGSNSHLHNTLAGSNPVASLWTHGEKVVVFSHYIATGRVLSGLMHDEIVRLGAEKLGDVSSHLQRTGRRFFDVDSPSRRACDAEVTALLESYPQLAPQAEALREVSRRYRRTPSFLVRYTHPKN